MAELQRAEATVRSCVATAWKIVCEALCDRGFDDADVGRKAEKAEKYFGAQLAEDEADASPSRHAGARRFVKTANDRQTSRETAEATRAGIAQWPALVARRAADAKEKARRAPRRVAAIYRGRKVSR